MTGKAATFWRGLSPSSRIVCAALLLAVAVHALLLVSFRVSPMEGTSAYGELPKVGRIDLDAPGNRQFLRWLENHDPALMTAVDRRSGYSNTLAGSSRKIAVEDLPSPPLLSSPRTLKPASVDHQAIARQVNLLPGETFYLISGKTARTASASSGGAKDIALQNGKSLKLPPPAVKILQEACGKAALTVNGLPVTVIAVRGTARSTPEKVRLILIKSSGVPELDNAALRAVRFCTAAFPETKLSGEISILWSNINAIVKEKK